MGPARCPAPPLFWAGLGPGSRLSVSQLVTFCQGLGDTHPGRRVSREPAGSCAAPSLQGCWVWWSGPVLNQAQHELRVQLTCRCLVVKRGRFSPVGSGESAGTPGGGRAPRALTHAREALLSPAGGAGVAISSPGALAEGARLRIGLRPAGQRTVVTHGGGRPGLEPLPLEVSSSPVVLCPPRWAGPPQWAYVRPFPWQAAGLLGKVRPGAGVAAPEGRGPPVAPGSHPSGSLSPVNAGHPQGGGTPGNSGLRPVSCPQAALCTHARGSVCS